MKQVRRVVSRCELERMIVERRKACFEIEMVVGTDGNGAVRLLPALPIPEDLAIRLKGRDLISRTKVNVDFLGSRIFIYLQVEWPEIMDAMEYWIEGKPRNYLVLTLLCSQRALALTTDKSECVVVDGFRTEALAILLEQWISRHDSDG